MPESRSARVAVWAGVATAAVAGLGLVGRATGTLQLAGQQAQVKPMAVWVGTVLVLLGLALAGLVWRGEHRGLRAGVAGAGLLVFAAAATTVASQLGGWAFDLDRVWPFMALAPLTAGVRSTTQIGPPALACAGLALFLLALGQARSAAGALALGATIAGFAASISYLYATPLVPRPGWEAPSLLGGVGTMILGIGTIAATGPGSWPLRVVSGSSVQAMLLRWFVPFIALMVVATDVMTVHLFPFSYAIGSVLNTVFTLTCSLVVVYFLSRTIGGRLDRAEVIEGQLRQSQKMEAVGQLAGGIAHDFNNLLTAIRGYAEFVIDSLEPGDRRRGDAEQIAGAADRAAQLTHRLLAFSRRQPLDPKVIDAARVVTGMQNLLGRLIGATVRLRVTVPPGVMPVRMDSGQLEQVVMNLAVNARDAMPAGGSLVIDTGLAEFDEGIHWSGGTLPAGRYVALSVSDTGVGMTPEIRERLFEPFFTTKEPGRGTGLGLSTVFGIVRQCGGAIVVLGEPGQGATFRVYLPWVGEPVTEVAPPERVESIEGRETVLVVDDDAQVRALAERAFRQHGYRVIVAASGEDALAVAAGSGPVDLLVTDFVLPRLPGRELAERLRASFPNVSVLCVTGYDGRMAEEGPLPGAVMLQKPFTPRLLVRTARELLDRRVNRGR